MKDKLKGKPFFPACALALVAVKEGCKKFWQQKNDNRKSCYSWEQEKKRKENSPQGVLIICKLVIICCSAYILYWVGGVLPVSVQEELCKRLRYVHLQIHG